MHRALVFMREIQHRFGVYGRVPADLPSSAMQLSEAMGDAPRMADDLQWLSLAYEQLGDMDRAVDMSRKALFLFEHDRRFDRDRARHAAPRLNALVMAGRFDEVIEQGESALAYYVSKGDSIGQAGVWTARPKRYMAQGRMADALPLLHKAERVLAIAGLQQDPLQGPDRSGGGLPGRSASRTAPATSWARPCSWPIDLGLRARQTPAPAVVQPAA